MRFTLLQRPKMLITLEAEKVNHQETGVKGLICLQTVMYNTFHNKATTENKTTWSHHLQQIAVYCPHTVKLVLTRIKNSK